MSRNDSPQSISNGMSRGNSLIAGVVLVGLLGSLAVALQAGNPEVAPETYTGVIRDLPESSQVAASATITDGEETGGCVQGVEYKVSASEQTVCDIKAWCGEPLVVKKKVKSKDGKITEEVVKGHECTKLMEKRKEAVKGVKEKSCKDPVVNAECGIDKATSKPKPCALACKGNVDGNAAVKTAKDVGDKGAAYDKALENFKADPTKANQQKVWDAHEAYEKSLGKLSSSDNILKEFDDQNKKLADDAQQAVDTANTELKALEKCASSVSCEKITADQLKEAQQKLANAKLAQETLGPLTKDLSPDDSKTGCKTPPCTGTQPSGTQPSSGQPSSGQPSSGQPSSGQPSSGQPSSGQPSSGQPSGAQPSGNTFGQQPSGQQQCTGISQMLGLCQNQTQQQSQNYCVRSYNPVMIEPRPAGPGCLNYQQQQCGMIQQFVSGCPQQQNPYQNPYGQQCYPQYYCMNNTLYWGSPQQQQQQSQYGYNPYGQQQTCQNQVVQQCQYGCAQSGGGMSSQCAPNPQQPTSQKPTATITCGDSGQSSYDVGEVVDVDFSCTNAVTSTGNGFSTNGQLSGFTTVTIQKPPSGTDTVSYGLTCTAANNQTATNKCDIKINVVSLVMVANPKEVNSGKTSTIGWVTKGMKKCTISSPQHSQFTENNKNNTSTSGTAKSPTLTDDSDFVLTCTTQSDATKQATTTVTVN